MRLGVDPFTLNRWLEIALAGKLEVRLLVLLGEVSALAAHCDDERLDGIAHPADGVLVHLDTVFSRGWALVLRDFERAADWGGVEDVSGDRRSAGRIHRNET